MSMLCMPEGGMAYDWDLTYIIDGVYHSFLILKHFNLSSLLLRNDNSETCHIYPDFV